jgi:hypothetical protein
MSFCVLGILCYNTYCTHSTYFEGWGGGQVLKYSISCKGRREKVSVLKNTKFYFWAVGKREFSSELTNFSFGQGRKSLLLKYPTSVLGRGEKVNF